MGIFGALTTSVAGLRSQSYALENISGNIANSQTTAFKRIDTSFLDLIPDTGTTAQLSGSVTANSRETNTVQGDVQAASVATYMAINGDGFFAVAEVDLAGDVAALPEAPHLFFEGANAAHRPIELGLVHLAVFPSEAETVPPPIERRRRDAVGHRHRAGEAGDEDAGLALFGGVAVGAKPAGAPAAG